MGADSGKQQIWEIMILQGHRFHAILSPRYYRNYIYSNIEETLTKITSRKVKHTYLRSSFYH